MARWTGWGALGQLPTFPGNLILNIPTTAGQIVIKYGIIIIPTLAWFWLPPGSYPVAIEEAQVPQDNSKMAHYLWGSIEKLLV